MKCDLNRIEKKVVKQLGKIFLFFMPAFISSCSCYSTKFDCQPAEGIPCTPVHEIERMVVETSCGPDIFLPQKFKTGITVSQKGCGQLLIEPKRIWISPHITEEGVFVNGYYMCLSE